MHPPTQTSPCWHAFTHIHEKLFFKCEKRHWKKWACHANGEFIDCLLEKSFSCMYVYMYIFMKRFFQKHQLQTWHWHCKLDFWIGVLEKSSSIHTYTDVHVHCITEWANRKYYVFLTFTHTYLRSYSHTMYTAVHPCSKTHISWLSYYPRHTKLVLTTFIEIGSNGARTSWT